MKQKLISNQWEIKTLLAFSIFLLALINGACRQTPICSSQLVTESESLSKTTKASLYIENCGATSSESTKINLHLISQDLKPDTEGRMKDGLALTIKGLHQVQMLWKDDKNLLVKCLSCAPDTFHKITSTSQNVNIEFQSK